MSDSIRDSHEQPSWLLIYPDDIALADADRGRLVRRLNVWKKTLENGGLKLNVAKTVYLALNYTDPTSFCIGEDLVKYLGSVLPATGDIDCDVKARISKDSEDRAKWMRKSRKADPRHTESQFWLRPGLTLR